MTGAHVERGHSRFPDFDTWFGREFPGLPGWRPTTAAHSIPVEVTSGDGYSRPDARTGDPGRATIPVRRAGAGDGGERS